MRYIWILLLLCSSGFAQGVAVVKSLEGKAVMQSDAKGTKELSIGMELEENVVVLTQEETTLVLILKDGSVVTLGSNSILNLKRYLFEPQKQKYDCKLYFQKGSLVFESGDISKLSPQSFELKTPQGIVAIRGTKFVVKVE